MPKYKNFIESINRISPLAVQLIMLLQVITSKNSNSLFFVDSCPIEVCHIKRASSNKVAEEFASRKKSSMGWFYGFKLHAVCNEKHQIVSLQITTGSVDDREPLEALVKNLKGIIIADAGYIGAELRDKLLKLGIRLQAAPRNNMKVLMSKVEHLLLKKRQTIERVFSVFKTRFGLNCSLARSIRGMFTMILTALLWYQINTVF